MRNWLGVVCIVGVSLAACSEDVAVKTKPGATAGDATADGGLVDGAADDVAAGDGGTGDGGTGTDGGGDAAPVCDPAQCDDKNPCTDDGCGADGKCENKANAAACDDGDACTGSDTCKDGTCAGGAAKDCDDKNVCTTDSCDKAKGCVNAPVAPTPCDDGDGCTVGEQCNDGKCGSGAPNTCDDGNACTDDTCDLSKGCSHVNNAAPCSDGNACTSGDACKDGACAAGATQLACDDQNPCTGDACDPKSGACVFLPAAATCDDGDNCTSGDACVAGACVGASSCGCKADTDCNDKNPCTADTCKTGTCDFAALAVAATCSDGDACTEGDACDKGKCVAGKPLACNDNNPCTDDACVPALGCVSSNNTAACDDGNACTSGDKCASGACVAGSVTCKCKADADCDDKNGCTDDACVNGQCVAKPAGAGKACDDGNVCTTGDACQGGVCLPGAATKCDDGNACTDDACNPKTGCASVANTTPCNDGNACTKADACSGGKCAGGQPTVCDDGNPCTSDACDPVAGCTSTDNTAACDDGDACTSGDVCGGGKCAGATPVKCDDGNPCTADACDKSKGCQAPAVADGTVCLEAACAAGSFSANSTCKAGKCEAGAKTDCDDKNPCTDDTCDAKTGCAHANNTAACQDGDACTVGDACKDGVCLPGTATSCDDSNVCTADLCDAKTGCKAIAVADGLGCKDKECLLDGTYDAGSTCAKGVCKPLAALESCDDQNGCTVDSCVPATGCAHLNTTDACDDGTACTSGDVCGGGKCVAGQAVSCDDGNLCTDDKCDPKLGCVFTPNATPCDDGDACTKGDICNTGKCLAGGPTNCNDGNVCTDDSCDKQKSCLYVPNKLDCSDGSACTLNDTCVGGSCLPGLAPDCNDKILCTTDSCDPKVGCVNAKNTAPCDDGSLCTVNDACDGGFCKPGAAANCDDKNPCTTDSCDKNKGCVNAANTQPCDNNNPCDGFTDQCTSGKCVGGANPCDDGNPCTADLCDAGGSCSNPAVTDGTVCIDASCGAGGYSTASTCTAGTCGLPAVPKSCDDGNPCTTDSCNPSAGCQHANNSLACNDGDACTSNDTCAVGKCVGGVAPSCDDGKPCTTDACDKATGCTHANNTLPCDDGDACTAKDTCGNGACQPGTAVNCDDNNVCTTDSCDKAKGCVNTVQADGTVCGDDSACAALVFQAATTCQAGKCVKPAAVNCDDKLECTVDTCDAGKGCANANKPYGTACTTAAASQLYPFCAGSVCTGLEPVTAQVSGTASTRGFLEAIDRRANDKIYPGGSDYAPSFNNVKYQQGIVTSLQENPLTLLFNSQAAPQVGLSVIHDLRNRIAVGGRWNGNNPLQSLVMTWVAPGFWQVGGGPSLNVNNVGTYNREIRAVDGILAAGQPEWYAIGGDSTGDNDNVPGLGYFTWSSNQWSSFTPIQVVASKTSCGNNASNLRNLTVQDLYAASTTQLFAVGTSVVNNVTLSMLAYWDNTVSLSCGGDLGNAKTAVVSPNDFAQTLVFPVSANLGQGALRTVHGTSNSHLMVGGGAGTLWSFDAGKWTQQTPAYTGMPFTWGTAVDVRSVYLVGNEAYVVGTVDANSCRTGFWLHGTFANGVWAWNKALLLTNEARSCGNNSINFTVVPRVWQDAATGSVYLVGGTSTDNNGKPKTDGNQQWQVVARIKTK